jgi:hypothetical protein
VVGVGADAVDVVELGTLVVVVVVDGGTPVGSLTTVTTTSAEDWTMNTATPVIGGPPSTE